MLLAVSGERHGRGRAVRTSAHVAPADTRTDLKVVFPVGVKTGCELSTKEA
jgi:hypothetical protein